MRFSGYKQNPLEWSESPRVRPAPPGRRAGGEHQEVLVTEIAGTTGVEASSFKELTSSSSELSERIKDASRGGQ